MSYLDTPRIHIGGTFFTDPSTVNNDPTHYDPACENPSPWQTPLGEHRFQFRDSLVRSLAGPDGPVTDDPLLGGSVATTDSPGIGRIVDLDVYQQSVSTLYGLRVQLNLGDGQPALTGTLDPATLNSVWFNAVLPTRSWGSDYGQGSYGGDMNACGYFQTVIRVNQADWTDTTSPLLGQLQQRTQFVDGQWRLSFKFVVDGYHNIPEDPQTYLLGRFVGTIGPVLPDEPLYNLGQRYLWARPFDPTMPWYWPSINDGLFKVDPVRKRLILDLANSFCRQTAAGLPADLGTLSALSMRGTDKHATIGTVNYSDYAYKNCAGITELPLTDEQVRALEHDQLQIRTDQKDLGPPLLLSEPDGPTFAVEVRPVRMMGEPGTLATTRVYVNDKNKPLSGKQLAVVVQSVHGSTPGATVPPFTPGDTPQADGALQVTITPSDALGYAVVSMYVLKDPGYRTPELDGQLYFIIVYDPALTTPDLTQPPRQEHLISCLVWSDYAVNATPTWDVVQGLMAPYRKLYGSMRARIDLTDQHSFDIFAANPPWAPAYHDDRVGPLGLNAGAITYYLTMPDNDPRYMPVTRDLSPNKVLTILHYIKNLQKTNQPVPH